MALVCKTNPHLEASTLWGVIVSMCFKGFFMQSKVLTIIILSLMFGCQSTPQNAESGKGLLIGEDSSAVKVMIRQIDKGDILWEGNYKLGTTASIEVGNHTVSIMCEFSYSWGKKLSPGTLNIDIKPDTVYNVSGKLSPSGDNCLVVANT
jgi:hypothetical protein